MRNRKHEHPERCRLRPAVLVPFYLQALFFATTTPEEDERLLADLRNNGQRDPIIVVPAKGKRGQFVILDGHRRVAGARALDWPEVEALIRWDLIDAEEATVEAEFLRFNFNRRHVHKLDQARIAMRLFEIEKKRPRDSLRLSNDESEARDRVGRLLGMSGRHLQRLFRVLLTPLPVQHTVRDGRLPMVLGEKVEGLPEKQQAEIAQRIVAGEDPKAVVAQYIATTNGRHKKATDAFRSFTNRLEAAVVDLEGRTDQVYRKEIKDALPLFDRVADLLKRLRAEAKKRYVDTAGLAEMAKAMGTSHAGAED